MTLTYFNTTASVTFDGGGTGTAVLRPDTGQYWIPKLTRVSTVNQLSPFAYAAVYAGAPTVLDPSTFVDDTYSGNQDSSSVVSGSVIQFGQAITARWQRGTPGDTGILTVIGVSSDVPPAQEILNLAPGNHFSGRVSPGSAIIPATSLQLPVSTGGTVSMNAVYVGSAQALYLSVGPPAQAVGVKVELYWYDYNRILIDADTMYTFGGGNESQLRKPMRPKAPLLTVRLTSGGIATDCTVTLIATPGTEVLLGPTNMLSQDFTTINAGATVLFDSPVHYIGQAYLDAAVSGTAWDIELLSLDQTGATIAQLFKADNQSGPYHGMVYLTGGRIRAKVTNGSAAAQGCNLHLVGAPQMGF